RRDASTSQPRSPSSASSMDRYRTGNDSRRSRSAFRNNVQERNGTRKPVENTGVEIDRTRHDNGARERPKQPRAKAHQPTRRTAWGLGGFREVNLFPKGFEFGGFHRDKLL